MKLNNIFSDDMILQANRPVYVFGIGAGTVTVEISGKAATVVSNEEEWLVELPGFDYGGPYQMTVNLNGDVKELKNIYFGDVYLLAGQSNNQLKLWETVTPVDYYKDNDALRLFTLDPIEDRGKHVLTEDGWKAIRDGNQITMNGEHYESKDGWVKAKKDEVCFWPAIGYLLGDELTKHSDRKIGLIACYQGASVIQSWLPEHFLEDTEYFVPMELRTNDAQNRLYRAWNGDGNLYNAMIKPILPFSMKAVLWYQGEGNSSGGDSKKEVYAGILKMLIEKWRNDFKDENLNFIVIQIHNFLPWLNKQDGGWRDIQAAQEMAVKMVKNAYLVKSADVCETNHIHPPTKLPLALRVAEVAKRF